MTEVKCEVSRCIHNLYGNCICNNILIKVEYDADANFGRGGDYLVCDREEWKVK